MKSSGETPGTAPGFSPDTHSSGASMRRPITAQWESYKSQVVPKQASAGQIEVCRRAFYTGAMAMQWEMGRIADLDDHDLESAALDNLQADLGEFIEPFKARTPENDAR